MRVNEPGTLSLSPTLLTTFVACPHAGRLELERRLGRPVPDRGRDPDADLLAELGARHEAAYLDHLRAEGLTVVTLGGRATEAAVLEAMRSGADAIAQAPLRGGAWFGVADVLRKVPGPSELGGHHYEVEDTKLAATTRAATVLQLATYARLLGDLQGLAPERVHVVAPGRDGAAFSREALRVDDFDAVTALATERFEDFADQVREGSVATAPEPVEHCAVCPWWADCRARWRADDHLTLVANLGGAHRAELVRQGVATRAGLAARRGALGFVPGHGRPDAYLSAAHQADVQVRSDGADAPVVEPLPVVESQGLVRLPELSEHDVYLDLEGTPFFPGGGIEYLWGWSVGDGPVEHVWAVDRAGERRAFERFVDEVTAHFAVRPQAHVVHYGPYEPSALKRLMGRHATREEALDALLRREAFVDLLPVVRQAFRVGVEAYSLKDLERVHGFLRDEDLRSLGPRKRRVEHAIVLGADAAAGEDRAAVARYNADDVRSTIALHRWLEARRLEAGVPAKPPVVPEPSEELTEARQRIQDLVDRLTEGVPDDPDERTAEQAARWRLAHLLDFEWREAKVAYWVKFAHRDLTPEELEASPKGVAGLQVVEVIAPTGRARTPTIVYRYPPQELDVRSGDRFQAVVDDDVKAFDVEHDPDRRTLAVKQGKGMGEARFAHGFFWNRVDAKLLTEARIELAEDVLARGLDPADGIPAGRYRAARDLLLARPGRTATGFDASERPGEEAVAAATRLALALDGGVLPIQGPPGAGKTHTAAHVILALVAAGRRVAVTAISHAAVHNLLAKVVEVAREKTRMVAVGHVVGSRGGDVPDGVVAYDDYGRVAADLDAGRLHVVGGTAWAWSRPDFRERCDTLVIDEAGQFSLATALSVATAARSVLLLGDPQQLTQPIQGAHPDGAEVSALEHLLDGHATLPPERGLFLAETYRMHPRLSEFVSRAFYEGRLQARPENANLRLEGTDGLDGAGASFVPVVHDGRDGTAPEEVAEVVRLVERLTRPGARWVDKDAVAHPLRSEDVLVIAPFNRHVDALAVALPVGVTVGTVDRMQGREAPVVVFALGVSSLDLAPRGLEFLFNPHRCNVAVSRAKVRALVVGSPRLFEEVPGSVVGLRMVNPYVRMVRG